MSDHEEYSKLMDYIFVTLQITPTQLMSKQYNIPSDERLITINAKLVEWQEKYNNRSFLFYVGILRILFPFKNELSNWKPFLETFFGNDKNKNI